MKCVLSCTLLLGLVTLSTALQPAEAVASSLGDALEPASPSQWAQLEADDLRNDGSRDIWSIVATTYLARPTPTAGSKVAPPDDEDEDDAETEMVAVGSTRRRKRDKAANIFLTVKKLGILSPLLSWPLTALLWTFLQLYHLFLYLCTSFLYLLQTLLSPFLTFISNLLAPFTLLYALFSALAPLWFALSFAVLVGGSMGMAAAALGGAGLVSKEWDLGWATPWVEKVEEIVGGFGRAKKEGSREAVWERRAPSGKGQRTQFAEAEDDESEDKEFYPRSRASTSFSRSRTTASTSEEDGDESIQRWRAQAATRGQ